MKPSTSLRPTRVRLTAPSWSRRIEARVEKKIGVDSLPMPISCDRPSLLEIAWGVAEIIWSQYYWTATTWTHWKNLWLTAWHWTDLLFLPTLAYACFCHFCSGGFRTLNLGSKSFPPLLPPLFPSAFPCSCPFFPLCSPLVLNYSINGLWELGKQ